MTLGLLLKKLRDNCKNYTGEEYLVCVDCARLINLQNIDLACPRCGSYNRVKLTVL
jgi:Zn finger protein HypA/HybF involved in hydrogenase expression